MNTIYFVIFFISVTLAQVPRRIQVIENPQTAEDFDHQNKGCPENSECDLIMGQMMQKWKETITDLQKNESTESKKALTLESFRAKFGIPTEFYTNERSQLGFRPILHSSPCKEHNPKDKASKIFRGMSFVKMISTEKVIIWRDQTQIELDVNDMVFPQKVLVYFEAQPQHYYLPLGDQPLFIKEKSLFILKEDDGFYYMLKISPTGEWKVIELDPSKLGEWELHRQNTACPEMKETQKSKNFENEYCKTIWDMDKKKTVIMKLQNGC